jgi:hypothetical protein
MRDGLATRSAEWLTIIRDFMGYQRQPPSRYLSQNLAYEIQRRITEGSL